MPKRDYIASSGNVFADIGVPFPDEALAKAELAHKIIAIIRERRLTQSAAAKLLGIDQPKVSALTRGQLSGFSIERLMRFLMLFGNDIEITIKSRPRSRAHSRLSIAQ